MATTYEQWCDEQLVDNFYRGDNSAFEALLMRHKNRVYSYIYNTVREAHLADDIFQETFIKAIDTIKSGRYSSEGKFLAWILRIAHNNVIDHYRRITSDRSVSNDDGERHDLFNRAELCDNSHIESIERERSLREVERLITELPDEQQRVVMMRFYRDLSFKEIAEIEDISINTALGRMRYAIINMRKMIGAQKLELHF